MLMVTIVGAACTALGFFGIAAKFSPSFVKKCLGYEWMIDLAISIGVIFLFAGAGITAMLVGIITGVIFSGVLFCMKNIVGYSKIQRNAEGKLGWVEYPATWTFRTLGAGMAKVGKGVVGAAKEMIDGIKDKEPQLKLVVNNAA